MTSDDRLPWAKTTADLYLYDLGTLLKGPRSTPDGRQPKRRRPRRRRSDRGAPWPYYEVVSLMKDQATAYGLDPAHLSLADIDPDQDLL
jgi:hypothetical protein